MFLTNILLKKVKSKNILVLLESIVSGHKVTHVRERLAEKAEIIRYDPYLCMIGFGNPFCVDPFSFIYASAVNMECVYKELKKIRSI